MNGRRLTRVIISLLAITILLLAPAGGPTAAEPEPAFELGPASPNPFNPATTLNFTLHEPAHVSLRIRDLHGSVIDDLLDGFFDIGTHQAHWRGDHQNSGIYFVCLTVNGKTKVQRITLLK